MSELLDKLCQNRRLDRAEWRKLLASRHTLDQTGLFHRAAAERRVEIELLQADALVVDLAFRKLLKPLQQRQGVGSGVSFDIACHNVNAQLLRLMRGLQHGVGLPDPRRIAEKDFQPSFLRRTVGF